MTQNTRNGSHKMDRKNFLKKTAAACISCCGAALLSGGSTLKKMQPDSTVADKSGAWTRDLENRIIRGAESPDWHKAEKAGIWIRDLMVNLDALFDQDSKVKLMQACGKSCYITHLGWRHLKNHQEDRKSTRL